MKKILIVIVIIVVFLVLLYAVISNSLMNTFLGELDKKARDIPPPNVSDLIPPQREVIPDNANAYTYFVRAAKTMHRPSEHCLDMLEGKAYDEELIKDFLSRNANILALIGQGLSCRLLQTPEPTLGYETPTPYLYEWKCMARILALKAMYERKTGHYAASAGTCAHILKFGHLILEDANGILIYLVGCSIMEMGFEQSRQLAYEAGPTNADLAPLVRQLALPDPFYKGLILAGKHECQIAMSAVEDCQKGKLKIDDAYLGGKWLAGFALRKAWKSTYFFQPNRTKQMFAYTWRQTISNASRPYSQMDFSLCRSLRKSVPWEEPHNLLGYPPNFLGYVLRGLLCSGEESLLDVKCREEASAAAARIIFACRAYKIDTGDFPQSLGALVPKYLDNVPSDPYDGQPFRYSYTKRITYSVGKDLKDSGGSEAIPADVEGGPPYEKRYKAEDIVFPLEMKLK